MIRTQVAHDPRAARTALWLFAASSLVACSVGVGAGVEVVGAPAARLSATWYTIGESGYEIDCHAAADVVRISAFDVDTGEVFVDVFDCALEGGVTDDLPLGPYSVDVELVLCGDGSCAASPYVVDGFTVDLYVDRDGALFDLGDFELIAPPGPSA